MRFIENFNETLLNPIAIIYLYIIMYSLYYTYILYISYINGGKNTYPVPPRSLKFEKIHVTTINH